MTNLPTHPPTHPFRAPDPSIKTALAQESVLEGIVSLLSPSASSSSSSSSPLLLLDQRPYAELVVLLLKVLKHLSFQVGIQSSPPTHPPTHLNKPPTHPPTHSL